MDEFCNNFDTPWKDILENYFQLFMQFCLPEIALEIDWSRGYESLDKELSATCPETELGDREVDKLFKIWKLDGEESWILFHVEIQGQRVTKFEKRMFVYHYRLFDRYEKPLVSLAILTDKNKKWRPNFYQHNLWGCKLEFHFLVIKLKDYSGNEETLYNSNNPFAFVILSHLTSIKSFKSDDDRFETKKFLTGLLYKKRFGKQEIINLFRFLDWIICLPKPWAIKYRHEVFDLEEQNKMPYISSIEKLGYERGELSMLKELLIVKFGKLPETYNQLLEKANSGELKKLCTRILFANTLDDVFLSAA